MLRRTQSSLKQHYDHHSIQATGKNPMISAENVQGIRIGTVDNFQRQEAEGGNNINCKKGWSLLTLMAR
ncbi:MAG TPA: hypothetical protein VK553_04790 [Candidatus Nitrosopolaris rasttigaisensis]|jgi:hypothetical protein|nr:hypothetical protein [Candidatus Nitrosopolaris rasttigaisensis]